MEDVILIAVIVVFFVAGALLVRVLDRMIVRSGADAGSEDEAEMPGREPLPGRPA
jgi:ABC-type thiamin/hydroxymethylpyrimidine transport system permease subunit